MHKPPLDEERLEFARELRRSSTDAENLVWRRLRGRQLAGLKFRRQHPVGAYVLDFFCAEKQLAVEIDGGQHYQDGHRDEVRDLWLAGQGILVLRVSAREAMLEADAVLEWILQVATER
ncbi:hypothetical protein D9M68_832110 [compost metagenome]